MAMLETGGLLLGAASPDASLPEMVAGLVLVGLMVLSFWFYARLARRVQQGEGRAFSAPFELPDMLVVVVLGIWFLYTAINGFFVADDGKEALEAVNLVTGAIFWGFLVAVLSGFMLWRRFPLRQFLTRGGRSTLAVVGLGIGLVLLAYPGLLLISAAMVHFLEEEAQQQEIVELFREAAAADDFSTLIVGALMAIVVAPVAEEFLFRGYFYGTLRRFSGPLIGMLLTSALFAVVHVNLLALPTLFALAICLTLAYEWSGSLWVPMVMHMFFNMVTLVVTYLQGTLA